MTFDLSEYLLDFAFIVVNIALLILETTEVLWR